MEVIAECVFNMKLDASAEENERFMQNAISALNPAVNKSSLVIVPCNTSSNYRLRYKSTKA
jgi:hypothetical protein